jgi:hypothetical protein
VVVGSVLRTAVGEGLSVVMLPSPWVERLHHGSVMGGEMTTRGTRGTHGECAKADGEIQDQS